METIQTLVKKYSKMGTGQVVSQMSRVTGNAREACLEVLRKRGQDISEWEEIVEDSVKPSELRKVGSSSIFEDSPEGELTQKESQRVKIEERELDKEKSRAVTKKEVVTSKKVIQTKTTVLPLTSQQKDKINQDIDVYQRGEINKKDMIVSWMSFGITKQQIDKFVDPKIVGWSYAYSVYREYGK